MYLTGSYTISDHIWLDSNPWKGITNVKMCVMILHLFREHENSHLKYYQTVLLEISKNVEVV